jgi:ABC-2 type transport system permease protein
MAKLAGKIFRVGMLMYGKEADPKEMWKWVRQ